MTHRDDPAVGVNLSEGYPEIIQNLASFDDDDKFW